MSCIAVRDAIKAFCAAQAPTEKYIDLTAEFRTLQDLMKATGLTLDSKWLGVEFIADPEIAVALNASNTEGGFREEGSVSFHFVAPAAMGISVRDMLVRAENFKKAIRNRRLGKMIVEEVVGPNTGTGATLQFDSGFMSATILIGYHIDISPSP